jgi:hypothetical protein
MVAKNVGKENGEERKGTASRPLRRGHYAHEG